MKPYYEHGGVTIYHGDCFDVCNQWIGLRTKTFDLLLTDPPYGHGDKWSGGTWASDPMYEDAMRWDRSTVSSHDLVGLMEIATRAVVWGGNYYALPPSRCWFVWLKSSQMPTLADVELAWSSMDQPAKLLREDRNPDGKRWHPTQKPESLMRWVMQQVKPAPQTIIDPFMGSGTTLVAAKRLGKQAVGIEREERYCEIAAKRLAQEALPLEFTA